MGLVKLLEELLAPRCVRLEMYERLTNDGEQKQQKKQRKKKQKRKGYIPIIVVLATDGGDLSCSTATCTCFLLPTSCINHPFVAQLLESSSAEFGLSGDYTGALRLACTPSSFDKLVGLIASSDCKTTGSGYQETGASS
jgi:hypothetical protein